MSNPNILEAFLIHRHVTLDSRLVDSSTIFFAIKGENHDANDFIDEELIHKSALVITNRKKWEGHPKCIIVQDTLEALQNLATDYRAQFKIPVIGITGSNGKTTTKELIVRVLSGKFKVHATSGNFNNHFGVPLTLLKMPEETEIAVIEMGANHQGEIAALSKIAKPDYGLITSIGKAHLEGFGGITGVAKGKSELFQYVKSKSGVVFYHTIDTLLLPYLENYTPLISIEDHQITIHGNKFHFEIIQTEPSILFYINDKNGTRTKIESVLFGIYNFRNILSAITLGLYFHLDMKKIAEGIASFIPDNNRTQQLKWKNFDVILDAYNANPTSMRASIQALLTKPTHKILLILGSMKELGVASEAEHQDLLDWISKNNWFDIYLYGEEMYSANRKHQFKHFNSLQQIESNLSELKQTDLLIFAKGSRSNQLEKVFQL